MTDAEAWVHFYVAVTSGRAAGRHDVSDLRLDLYAGAADAMLEEYKKRFPSPVPVDAACIAECIKQAE